MQTVALRKDIKNRKWYGIWEHKQLMIKFLCREKFYPYQQPKSHKHDQRCLVNNRVLTECRVFRDADITTYSCVAIKILLFHEYMHVFKIKIHYFLDEASQCHIFFYLHCTVNNPCYFFVCLNDSSSSWVKVPSIQAKYILPRSWPGRIYCMCSWQWSQRTVDYVALSASLAVQTLNLVKRGS